MNTSEQAYLEGFTEKCAQEGVDPSALEKRALFGSRKRKQENEDWQKSVLEERKEILAPFIPKLKSPNHDLVLPQSWMDIKTIKQIFPPDQYEYMKVPRGGGNGLSFVRKKDVEHKSGNWTTHIPIHIDGIDEALTELKGSPTTKKSAVQQRNVPDHLKQTYLEGFTEKCAQEGVDPSALAIISNKLSELKDKKQEMPFILSHPYLSKFLYSLPATFVGGAIGRGMGGRSAELTGAGMGSAAGLLASIVHHATSKRKYLGKDEDETERLKERTKELAAALNKG